MLAAWSHQTTAAGGRKEKLVWELRRVVREFLRVSLSQHYGEEPFWRPDVLAAWSHQTTAAGGRKKRHFF